MFPFNEIRVNPVVQLAKSNDQPCQTLLGYRQKELDNVYSSSAQHKCETLLRATLLQSIYPSKIQTDYRPITQNPQSYKPGHHYTFRVLKRKISELAILSLLKRTSPQT